MGQLQNKKASDALSQILRDGSEHAMVRHEAAEALGSIAGLASAYIFDIFFWLLLPIMVFKVSLIMIRKYNNCTYYTCEEK